MRQAIFGLLFHLQPLAPNCERLRAYGQNDPPQPLCTRLHRRLARQKSCSQNKSCSHGRLVVGFASKEACARWRIIMISTLFEPIAGGLQQRAAFMSYPCNAYDASVEHPTTTELSR
jgi:hypothetical protein